MTTVTGSIIKDITGQCERNYFIKDTNDLSSINHNLKFWDRCISIPVDRICHRWDFHWTAVEEDNNSTLETVELTLSKTITTVAAAQMVMLKFVHETYKLPEVTLDKSLTE